MKARKKSEKLHQPAQGRGRVAHEPISARARGKGIVAPASKAASKRVAKMSEKPAARKAAKPVKKVSRKPAVVKPALPGRKSLYSADLGDRICALIADGVTWADVEKKGLCSRRTLATWLRTIPDFHEHYARAREARAEFLVSELEAQIERLKSAEDNLVINSARVICEQLRWMISSYFPKMYGTKIRLEAEDSRQQELYDYSRLSDTEIKTLLALMEKALVTHGHAEPA
jgi:hypothetical protein